jgi:CheY-like chemotaxis protein
MAQKILIVDDNSATRGELAKLLADAGFETTTAATVPEAMRALATPRRTADHRDSSRQLQRAAPDRDGAQADSGHRDHGLP